MKYTIVLTFLILLLAFFGGMQVYTNPIVTGSLGAAGWVTAVAYFFVRGKPIVWGAIWPLPLPVIASFLANLDILPVTGARMFLYGVALAVLFVTARLVTAEQLFQSLWLAGWLWPLIWIPLRPEDNVNVVAVWPVVFVLVGLAGWQVGRLTGWILAGYIITYLILLLCLGSRGPVLGLMAGWVILFADDYKEKLVYRVSAAVGAGGIIAGLILWRPETSIVRLHYWQQALSAFLANPVFGVGPGGLWARHLITEPGGGFQVHAHNFIISSGAELGLVGLAALLYAGWRLYVKRSTLNVQLWQLAIVAALLCHSLVDEPLFWPGPLMLLALVCGTIRERS